MISRDADAQKIEKFNYFSWIRKPKDQGGPLDPRKEDQLENDVDDDKRLYNWAYGRIPIAGELHIAVPVAQG